MEGRVMGNSVHARERWICCWRVPPRGWPKDRDDKSLAAKETDPSGKDE